MKEARKTRKRMNEMANAIEKMNDVESEVNDDAQCMEISSDLTTMHNAKFCR